MQRPRLRCRKWWKSWGEWVIETREGEDRLMSEAQKGGEFEEPKEGEFVMSFRGETVVVGWEYPSWVVNGGVWV